MGRALVTAATSSIGRVLAEELFAQGYELLLHYHSNERLAAELSAQYGAKPLRADLSTGAGISAFVEALLREPRFDVVVNNAGILGRIDENDLSAWARIFSVNSIAPAVVMANAERLMNIPGLIVNISSALGEERSGGVQVIAYSATKAALNSLTRSFAKRLAPQVRVNAIAPGLVASEWNRERSEREREELGREQLIGRLIDPREIASLLAHMIENQAFVGEVVYLDGGLNLASP